MTVHVLFENEDWMPPLRRALADRGLEWVEHFVDGGVIDLASLPEDAVYINRMSPSSHTRGHQAGVVYTRELLGWLEATGRRVVNGSRAFTLELSKVQQHASLDAFGIRTPRTIAVVGNADPREAARQLPAPFITKHNQGGKGLGVQLFEDHESFDAYVEAEMLEPSPDGVLLLQQYIRPAQPFITRVEIVDGRFLYAIRSSTEGGFELCPADACTIGDSMCPVGGEAEAQTDDGETRFQLRAEITAADPLVRQYVAFMATHRLDVAGIEFVEDADNTRWTYDINGTSNYNGGVEAEHGLDGMGAIADLCVRLLQTPAQQGLHRVAAR